MNNKNKSLFSEFSPVTKQEWMEKVTIDLKGDDFNRKLVWKNLSKIDIQPFYNVEDCIAYLKNTGENSQSLINYRNINVTDAENGNKLGLKAIEEGINGLIFEIKENVSVAKLLDGIDLNQIAISFNLTSNEVAFATDFFAFVNEKLIALENLKGYFNTHLFSNYVTIGNFNSSDFDTISSLVNLAKKYPNYKAITVSGTEYLDSGANQVQEVAYTLNSLVFLIEKLTERKIEVQTIFNNLNFQLAIGSEYFVEIGKFRAFNNLLAEIASKYNVFEFSNTITAKTSVWSKSITDAHTNLLRATTEAMSAILGNVNGVLIDAYDKEFNEFSNFSSRIAGNISTILKEESYFGKVSNPVDGSYYIEEVTIKIAEKALELFKEIEIKGGFYTAFESEIIQQQIAEIRQEKIKLISQRRLPMVGVNKYPNLMETVDSALLSSGSIANSKVLKPRRASLEIEAVRKTTEEFVAKTSIRPTVELTSFGNLTMRKARAAFAYDFIGVSGYNVLQEKSFLSAIEAAQESAKSNSNVVVICSSDQDYDENAVSFVKAFRALNTDKVLLLAGAPANLSELTEVGLDGCVNMKSDVITTLSNIQKKIQKTIKS
ncbi:methylmalonyl-CoA mutase family protein [Lutibacter sp.]|uniref:methylmalonyl-CoA mutase family protein n=1 Tax=Lutibacter sp. TaxID=1925666 RepID=UPI002734AB72|nr:methylmalonyl-CoA mutase family protein [Lutibacter sp.]MDP3313630.1 methylmalonyl-CoA mutase family protein [Lutibacter sp.]